MLADVSHCWALMSFWIGLCVALQVSHGWQLDPTMTEDTVKFHHATGSSDTGDGSESLPAFAVSHLVPHIAPCLLGDISALMREGLENDNELTNSSLTLFGICAASENTSGSVLLELAKKASRNQRDGLEVLHPTGVFLVEEQERAALTLIFGLPPSPLLKLIPVLLLTFESPVSEGDLEDILFTSPSLHPHSQATCISGGTQYILLTGKASEGNVHQTWSISIETKSPDTKKRVKELFIPGKSRSNSMNPFLLFTGGTGTDTRNTEAPGSWQTLSFLCELRRFMCDVLPQNHADSPPLKLGSLQSLPRLTLGLSSSEIMLAALINSSAPTIFSFSSSMLHVHRGELALPPALLEELRQRLEQSVMKMMEVLREGEEGHRIMMRLERLKGLCAFPKAELASGESQYCAFLLLKALKTVGREMQRKLRATRAEPNLPVRNNICGLRSLTVSLGRHLVGPNTANINNCHGSCTFPFVNTKNHAVLLNSHIESGNVQERAPCCVPVAYEALEVVDLNQHGTYLSIKPDVVAKECGCR